MQDFGVTGRPSSVADLVSLLNTSTYLIMGYDMTESTDDLITEAQDGLPPAGVLQRLERLRREGFDLNDPDFLRIAREVLEGARSEEDRSVHPRRADSVSE